MKKLIVIPVMFLYILAVSGVMVYAHYCGDTLESWNVYLKGAGCEEGDCGDEEEQSDSCCKDKVVTTKVSQDQHHTDWLKLKLSQPVMAAQTPGFLLVQVIAAGDGTGEAGIHHANAPPGPWQQIPLYKLHSRLTYYG
jgi:hypothetical protein